MSRKIHLARPDAISVPALESDIFCFWIRPVLPIFSKMETVRRAVIDVGTNSIKLLVADVRGQEVQPVLEDSRQTRLGRGFYENHRLQPESIARSTEAVWE